MHEADADIATRESNMANVFDLFERELTLIGATAVEDQL